MTFYGTSEETYYVSDDSGRIYCVQSPDLRGDEVIEVRELPEGAEELESSCDDVEVSRDIFEEDERSASQIWEECCGMDSPRKFLEESDTPDDLGAAVRAYVTGCELFARVSDAGREWFARKLVEHAESELG